MEIKPHLRLRALRKHRKITQKEMAKLCSLSVRTYQRVESDDSPFDAKIIMKVSDRFEVSPEYFFKDEEQEAEPVENEL